MEKLVFGTLGMGARKKIKRRRYLPSLNGPAAIVTDSVYHDEELPVPVPHPTQPEPQQSAPAAQDQPQADPRQANKFAQSGVHSMHAKPPPMRPPPPNTRDIAPQKVDVTGYSKFGQAGVTHGMHNTKPERTPTRNEAGMTFGALLSAAAYEYGRDGFEKHVPQGMTVDQTLSDRHSVVFVSQETGKAYIAYRGTNFFTDRSARGIWESVTDLAADALITMGLENTPLSRFDEALDKARQVSEKYGKENVEATGHSLGGSQALYVNSRMGITARAYNPGFGPGDVANTYIPIRNELFGLGRIGADAPATVYHARFDPISVGTRLDATDNIEQVNVANQSLWSHSHGEFWVGRSDLGHFLPDATPYAEFVAGSQATVERVQ